MTAYVSPLFAGVKVAPAFSAHRIVLSEVPGGNRYTIGFVVNGPVKVNVCWASNGTDGWALVADQLPLAGEGIRGVPAAGRGRVGRPAVAVGGRHVRGEQAK